MEILIDYESELRSGIIDSYIVISDLMCRQKN